MKYFIFCGTLASDTPQILRDPIESSSASNPHLGEIMKRNFLIAACLILTSASASSQQTEEQCTKNVEATISAIETIAQMKGEEQKLKDLSIKDIRAIQKAKGSCAAMVEINKRTMN
jgi:hypothetical protein